MTNEQEMGEEMRTWHRVVQAQQKAFGRRLFGARADGRRRPKRIAKKLRKRGGYRRHRCAGANLAMACLAAAILLESLD